MRKSHDPRARDRSAGELPVEVTSVAFRRPSLDDVFLELTGRAVRADEADAKDMTRMMARAWGRSSSRRRW